MKKNLLRGLALAFALVFCLSLCPAAFAAEEEPEFYFELTVDGKELKKVETGDIITVSFKLIRTDAEADYTMYAMQNEIRYDSSFFEPVAGSAILGSGIRTTDIAVTAPYRECYMNFLSFAGGERWRANTRVGSFQLRVIATSGASKILNTDYLVSYKDGSGTYKATANEVVVALYNGCIVTFDAGEGVEVAPATVDYGGLLTAPEAPKQKGYTFEGWYKDAELTEPWNFETDVIEDDTTLYAKWTEGAPSLFDSIPVIVWPVAGGVLVLVIVLIAVLAGKKKKKEDYQNPPQPEPICRGLFYYPLSGDLRPFFGAIFLWTINGAKAA